MKASTSKHLKYKLRHYPSRIPPTVSLFLIALLLIWIGLGIPFLRILVWVGAFVVCVYVILWVVWLVAHLSH